METRRRRGILLFLVVALLLVSIAGSDSSVPSKETLGIAPQDEDYYRSSVIKCKDGSKKFTKEQLNDEFCDCPDGTDEPGTSACPEGRFYCQNKGHTPKLIFSSRVNDGICDCCDGSDEYDGNVKCTNTCWEAGKVAREKLKKKIATYQEGVILRKEEVEKAKKAFDRDELELSKLKNDETILKGLVQRLKEQKERIEKAEEQERLKKEKEEEKMRESEKKASEHEKELEEPPHDDIKGIQEELSESLSQDTTEDFDDSEVRDENVPSANTETSDNHGEGQHVEEYHDNVVAKVETAEDAENDDVSSSYKEKQHVEEGHANVEAKTETAEVAKNVDASSKHKEKEEKEEPVNTEGLSKEELGRLVASRWTGGKTGQQTDEVDNTAKEEAHEDHPHDSESAEEDYNGYNSESEEYNKKYDENETEDGHTDDEYEEDNVEPNGSYNPEPEDKTDYSDFTEESSPTWLEKIQQTVQNIIQTINIFKTPVNISDAEHVRKEYDESSSKLSKIQSRISSLTDKLKHNFGTDKEFYSFYDRCFENKENKYVYKVCLFKQASQVEGHSTTQLGYWEKFEESYKLMQFSNGDKCWNGPARSLKVRLRCGLKNELTDVDEPSRCEYVAILSTPVLCLEEKLKELQNKLDLMSSGQPFTHDEL